MRYTSDYRKKQSGGQMDINDAWKSTCSVLLKEEIGDLGEFEYYLKKFVGPLHTSRRSILSGKQVTTADDDIGLDVSYISNDEREAYLAKYSQVFDINAIKDIDSLISTLSERFIYSGDILSGRFHLAERVNRCSDVYEVHDSQDVSNSKYAAHCAMLRYSNYVFGSDCTGEIDYVVKNFQGWKSQRMWETTNTQHCSDVYFSANVRNCQEAIFSFNQEGKRHVIGNLELPKDRYFELKRKLLAEIADELRRKKDIISINEILGAPARGGKEEIRPKSWDITSSAISPTHSTSYFGRPTDYPIELDSAFATTTSLLLQKPLSGKMTNYESWLMRHVRAPQKTKSAMSGKALWVLPILFNEPVRGTHIGLDEAAQAGKMKLDEGEISRLAISNAKELLKPIALFTCDVALGENRQVQDVVSFSDSNTVFASSTMYDAKYCAYDCWVSHGAENMFGCDHVFYSKFCIHCYRSLRLTRCFEVSDSTDCSDCYFSHNLEGCSDCMFCFNVKAKRYAIGNVEMKKDDYLRIKKMILTELAARIEADKALDLDIYNISTVKSSKSKR